MVVYSQKCPRATNSVYIPNVKGFWIVVAMLQANENVKLPEPIPFLQEILPYANKSPMIHAYILATSTIFAYVSTAYNKLAASDRLDPCSLFASCRLGQSYIINPS